MDSFVAAIKFLMETALGAGAKATITYAAPGPTPPVGYTLLGTKTVATGFLAGYYKILVAEEDLSTGDDDFKGYILVS